MQETQEIRHFFDKTACGKVNAHRAFMALQKKAALCFSKRRLKFLIYP